MPGPSDKALPPPYGRRGLRWCLLALLLVPAGCTRSEPDTHAIGNPDAGAVLIGRMACGSCHVVSGIEEADGTAGPSLAHFGSQRMIAGVLANSPAALQRYLLSPQSVVKGNVMPDQRLTPAQARDVAAYLFTLK